MTSLRRGLQRRFRLLVRAFLNATLIPLSRLAPRRPDHWAFGHQGGVFAGNAKYLFLWMSVHRPDMRAVWLTDRQDTVDAIRDAGLLAYRRWSPGGVAAALRSRVFAFCHGVEDVNVHLSGGAFMLNLWHGVGLKAAVLKDKSGIQSRSQVYRGNAFMEAALHEFLTSPDLVATTSPFMQAHFADQFEIPAERCPQLGYPRLDASADPQLKALSASIDRKQGFALNPGGYSEVYIYLPTFRDTGRPFLEQAIPDLKQLSEALRARNALLYVKVHPRTLTEDIESYDNIAKWPPHIDFYTYLEEFDVLITDYSSILYDYLFVKPSGALLYTFDYDDYLSKDRSLLYPFDENTAGLRVSTFDELCAALRAGAALKTAPDAEAVRRKFWGDCVAPVSPGLVTYVRERVEAA